MYPPAVLDCYLVLGIHEEATEKEIHNAYKSLALKLHPDKVSGSEEVMKQVNEAREILGDARQRYEYDSEYPFIKRKWQRYRAWVTKTETAGDSEATSAEKDKRSNAKKRAPKSKPNSKKTKTKPKKKVQKKLKAKPSPVKYETTAEDIGPQFKVIAHGIEMTLEEHAKTCGCRAYQQYKTNPEAEYSSGEGDDDEYKPDEWEL